MKARRDDQERAIIGWQEFVDLPEWGIVGMKAKIDTGARTTALHVEDVEELPHDRVRFCVVVKQRRLSRLKRRVRVVANISRRGRVRSTEGAYATRIFVTTALRLGGIVHDVEMNLVDRGRMIHRMIVGRTALGGRFLVDVSRKRVHGKSVARTAGLARRIRRPSSDS